MNYRHDIEILDCQLSWGKRFRVKIDIPDTPQKKHKNSTATNVVYIDLMIGTKPGGTEHHWREIEAPGPLHITPENTESEQNLNSILEAFILEDEKSALIFVVVWIKEAKLA